MKYTKTDIPLVCMHTESRCYNKSYTFTPKGVLWHSTGANNPSLKRYVQPSSNDANRETLLSLIGKNAYGNDWNKSNLSVGVNAFVGKLADGTVTSVQTLPWDMRPWGCGAGKKGSCNNGWIQFEICEDALKDEAYFDAVYQEACELTAYLCDLYSLDPNGTVTVNGVKVPVILCHGDSYNLGLGSNHVDVLHWFKKFNKTMEDVRNDVAALMKGTTTSTSTTETTYPVLRQGSSGEAVKYLQECLNELGYDCGEVDGKFGPTTLAQVKKFQTARGLTADGIVGSKTWAELEKNPAPAAFVAYSVKVTASTLNYRSGPGTNYKINGQVKKNQVFTIVEEDGKWGQLKSGAGWIYLPYTKKI